MGFEVMYCYQLTSEQQGGAEELYSDTTSLQLHAYSILEVLLTFSELLVVPFTQVYFYLPYGETGSIELNEL